MDHDILPLLLVTQVLVLQSLMSVTDNQGFGSEIRFKQSISSVIIYVRAD